MSFVDIRGQDVFSSFTFSEIFCLVRSFLNHGVLMTLADEATSGYFLTFLRAIIHVFVNVF